METVSEVYTEDVHCGGPQSLCPLITQTEKLMTSTASFYCTAPSFIPM